MVESAEPSEPSEPPVRRFYFAKRILASFAVVLLLLGAAWIAWDRYSRRQLEAAITATRAAGRPATLADLVMPAVPDNQNAALILSRAATLVQSSGVYGPSSSSYYFDDDLPYRPEWMAMTKYFVTRNADALALARRSVPLKHADWGLKITHPLMALRLNFLAPQRTLANGISDAALYAHFTGDEPLAIQYVETLFRQVDAVDRGPLLVSHLVSVGIDAMAASRLEIIAGDLRIDSPNGIDRHQVQVLMSRLLNSGAQIRSLCDALNNDSVFNIDTRDFIYARQAVIAPMYRLSNAALLETSDLHITVADQIDYHALTSKSVVNRSPPEDPACVFDHVFAPGMRGVSRKFCMTVNERRMAAIMLAARLFFIDHQCYPSTLAELVPAYLPAVPVDLFSPTGQPFGYILLNGGKRPILYSVGEDGKDQTADSSITIPSSLLKGYQKVVPDKPDDQLRDVSSWINPEPRPPMTETPKPEDLGEDAAPHQPDQAKDPGNNH